MMTFLRNQGINFSTREHVSYRLVSSGFMDLIIEIWIEDKILNISVSHYDKQNGDAMKYPEIIYLVNLETGKVVPSIYQNDYIVHIKKHLTSKKELYM